jgi:hypothetical protein
MTSPKLASLLVTCAAAAANLPVYIEDSHAGSFYWAIQNLDLNRDIQLVLIDAHSDSSEVFDSDAVRQKVLQAATSGDLDGLVRKWRSHGVIQCFDWVEPLIPHPFTKVWWVTPALRAQDRREVREQINAHEMTAAREEGDLSSRYRITDLNHLMKISGPVVVSIDLDYFATGGSLDRVLDRVLGLPGLQAITIAISRPYLASEYQAQRLLFETLRYLTHVINIDIHYEPFVTTGEDRSRKAKEFYSKRMNVPHYDIESAPGFLRSLLLANASRIEVDEDRNRWEGLLTRWRTHDDIPRISSPGDIPADRQFRIKLENYKGGQIHWKVLVPAYDKYNLTNGNQGFAAGAPKYLSYREKPVPAADGLSELDGALLIPFLDTKTGLGTLRVFCEVRVGPETYSSNVVRFSRYQGDNYLGKLTEIFNLPYVYGSAMLRADGKTSADARYGADCANFIVYGRRREGWNIPYVNPKDLLPHLEELDEFKGFQDGLAYGRHGPIQLTPALLKNGLLLHFGKHVAAVYEDHEGALTEQTRVVHQLETYPEITTFGAMARRYKQIRIMTFTSSTSSPKPDRE